MNVNEDNLYTIDEMRLLEKSDGTDEVEVWPKIYECFHAKCAKEY